MAKIPQLEKIMKEICQNEGIQEGVDITLGRNPARIYFTFEDTQNPEHPNYGKPMYLNSNGMTMDEVCRVSEKREDGEITPKGMAERYELRQDKAEPKYKEGMRFALGFKLKSVGK